MIQRYLPLVVAFGACRSGPRSAAPPTSPTPASPVFMIGHKKVLVQLKKPSSIDESAVRECALAGEPRRELFAPLVLFAQHNLLNAAAGTGLPPTTNRSLRLAVLLDETRDDSQPPLGSTPGFAVEVDPRAERGVLIVTRGAIDDYYCVDITEPKGRQEIVVTLDLYKAHAP